MNLLRSFSLLISSGILFDSAPTEARLYRHRRQHHTHTLVVEEDHDVLHYRNLQNEEISSMSIATTVEETSEQPTLSPTDASPPENDNDDETNWLNEHNNRRQEHHENYGVQYKPLSWSSGLQTLAKTKADYHASVCSLIDTNKSDYGKNSIMKLGGSSLTPEVVLRQWFTESRIREGYPENGAMTQVLWRASEYVGCATSDVDGCAIAICYYARPGNCGMDESTRGINGDWETKTYADTSLCTPFCPPEGCTLMDNDVPTIMTTTGSTTSSAIDGQVSTANSSTSSPSNKVRRSMLE